MNLGGVREEVNISRTHFMQFQKLTKTFKTVS